MRCSPVLLGTTLSNGDLSPVGQRFTNHEEVTDAQTLVLMVKLSRFSRADSLSVIGIGE